ncbi:Pycsar system effector family protein [Patiriisocius sp. Uisw_017]|uniref:Pycsar system effector family protein n=1 Tax=Patiriisocius sp. Uisw_017 TaxID=3230968 RepID=UPI0039E7624C
MSNIISETDDFILHLFKEKLPNNFVYHNYTHSKRVYKSIIQIINNAQINIRDTTILKLAALLHDTGYIKMCEGHEEESAIIAKEWLESKNVEPDIIEGVEKCILATKFDKEPNDKLEEIIRDADASHFGKDYFNEASEFLRQEYKEQGIREYTPTEWRNENIKVFVKKHQFYSEYAIKNWQPQKDKNLSKLIKNKKKAKANIKKEIMKAELKAKYKDESPERGIQSFFRTALKNHIKLSDIADTKANILLSVNAIIISLVLSNLLSKLDNNAFLVIPTAIFVVSSAITMILSVIATRPNVTQGEFTKEDVANKTVNLTFFGNFHKMDLTQYEWAIKELINDRDYIYSSMTKDLYFLGKVLDRKYRILRYTYTIFVIGTIVSIIAFAISFYMSGQPTEALIQVPLN